MNKFILYGVLILIATVLLTVLATYVAERANSNDLKIFDTFSTSDILLMGNGSSSDLSKLPSSSINATAKNYFIDFNGANQVVNISDNNVLDSYGNFSLGIWVYLNEDVSNIATNSIVDKLVGASGGYELRYTNGTKKVSLLLGNSTGDTISVSETLPLLNNTWTYYVATWNNDTKNITLYKDGVIDASTLSANFRTHVGENTQTLNMGSGSPTTNFANVSLDNVMYWNRGLLPSEVVLLNNTGRAATTNFDRTALIYWFPFNTNLVAGPIARDIQSQLNGTMVNSPLIILDNTTAIRNVQNTFDYTRTGLTVTLTNQSYSFNELNFSYDYDVSEEFGFHISVTKIIAGFVALMLFIFAATLVLKYYQEEVG